VDDSHDPQQDSPDSPGEEQSGEQAHAILILT
jgi:hypothetical protein